MKILTMQSIENFKIFEILPVFRLTASLSAELPGINPSLLQKVRKQGF